MSGQKYRQVISLGGPDGSEWTEFESTRIQTFSNLTSTGAAVYAAPALSKYSVDGPSPDGLPNDGNVKAIAGLFLMFDTDIAAEAAADIGFLLVRGGVTVGGAAFAGWTSGNAPEFFPFIPVPVPFNLANPALSAPPDQPLSAFVALMKAQPLDVVVMTLSSETPFDAANSLTVYTNAQ